MKTEDLGALVLVGIFALVGFCMFDSCDEMENVSVSSGYGYECTFDERCHSELPLTILKFDVCKEGQWHWTQVGVDNLCVLVRGDGKQETSLAIDYRQPGRTDDVKYNGMERATLYVPCWEDKVKWDAYIARVRPPLPAPEPPPPSKRILPPEE